MTARCNTPHVSRRYPSDVAHELNLCLGCAVAHADAVLGRIDTDEIEIDEVIAHLRAIRDAGRRAADLVRAVRATVSAAAAS